MNFAVAGSAHGHIYEFINDALEAGAYFKGVYKDSTAISKDIADRYHVPLFENLGELLDQQIDVVATTAVNNEKITYIEECAERGIHIIADKPVVTNEAQYKRLESIIGKGNIEVGLMLSMRFWPEVNLVKRLIQEGRIGNIINIEIMTPHKLVEATRPRWHFKKDENGGIIIDLLIHSIDLFRWMTESEIEDAYGFIHKKTRGSAETFFDSAEFLVKGKSGASGYLRTDWHMTDSHWTWSDIRIFCSGTKGCIEARVLGDPLTREPVVVLYEEGKDTVEIKPDKCSNSATKDFLDRIQGKAHLITHKDIIEATRLSLEFDRNANVITGPES